MVKRHGVKHLKCFLDRHGKPRVYFHRSGHRDVPLPLPIGSEEFLQVYASCLVGRSPAQSRGPALARSSLNDLVTTYRCSSEYIKLASGTKWSYDDAMRFICASWGDRPAESMRQVDVYRILSEAENRSASYPVVVLKVLRNILFMAVRAGVVTTNPASGVKPKRREQIEHTAWTQREIMKFQEFWPDGSTARLALAIFMFTGQRCGDVCRFSSQMIEDGYLVFDQEKTGMKMRLPVAQPLAEILAPLIEEEGLFLRNAYGRAFSAQTLSRNFSKWAKEAGLEGYTAHGLRHTMGMMLAEGNKSSHAIMAVLGHRSLSQVERYTSKYNRSRIAKSALSIFSADGA